MKDDAAHRGVSFPMHLPRSRRTFLLAAGALLLHPLAAPLAARAQQGGKVYHVGIVSIGTDPAQPNVWQPFFDAMRELNYVEGQNPVVQRYFGDGKAERLTGQVADLARDKVDVIVTTGDREIIALRRAVATTPIVFTYVMDPVGRGFVASLARPGGNITGISTLVQGQMRKHVELLREMMPSTNRFAVFVSTSLNNPNVLREYETAARALGMTMIVAIVPDRASYDGVLGQARKDGASAIIAPVDGETFRFRQELARLAIKHRLPGIYGERIYVEAGGMMSFGSSFLDRARRAATYVDKILRGADPGELPVEQPTKFELVVNMKTARALGVEIPQSILIRADEVIE